MTKSRFLRLSFGAPLLVFLLVFSYGCRGKGSPAPNEPAENRTAENGNPGFQNPENPDSNTNPSVENRNSSTEYANDSGSQAAPVRVPEGRMLSVRLLQTISSRTASPGQHFDAELASPVVVNGRTVLPRSTPLRGRVVAARRSGRLHKPGYLRLTLDSVRTPDGRWVSIRTTSVWAQGRSHKKRNLAFIGGGSGLGAVIGAVAGGGKGAAIGAAAGAGAGTAGAYATGKKDVVFPAERKLSFSTTREALIG